MVKTVLQGRLGENGGEGSRGDNGSGRGRHCGKKNKRWEVRVVVVGWVERKAKDGEIDGQRGQLIKETRNPEP